MTAKHIIPNAASVVRATLLTMIQDRRNGLDTSIDLGTRRTLARKLMDPGSYDLLAISEPTTTGNTDLV